MTATPAGRLLISHIPLRGPELAQLYAAIASRLEATLDDLRADFCPAGAADSPDDLADAPLREALSFLSIAGLVEARGRPRRYTVAAPSATPFALRLLHQLAAHPDERQRAIPLVYRQIVADDTLAITPQALRDQMERGVLRDLFAWTGEKLLLWAHLSAFIGLVRRSERSPELLIVPQPSLILDALRWARQEVGGRRQEAGDRRQEAGGRRQEAGGEGQNLADDISAPLPDGGRTTLSRVPPLPPQRERGTGGEGQDLADALSHIDAALFACFTARGRVHRGLSQTLLAMERLGHIRLTHHADAARSLLLGERRVSQVALTMPRITTDNSLRCTQIEGDDDGIAALRGCDLAY